MSQLHRVGKPTPQMFDCHFLPNEVKYIHNGCPLLEEDHVRATNLPTENVWILVRIKEAIPNTQARAAFMSMFILEIDQFILTPLTIAALDAEVGETAKDRLVFSITKYPLEWYITIWRTTPRPLHLSFGRIYTT
ncbi:unnamed protein product [Lepidochelys kempii]